MVFHMELKTNSISVSKFFSKKMQKFKRLMLKSLHLLLVITSFPLGLTLNTKNFLVTKNQWILSQIILNLLLQIFLIQLTGDYKVQLILSKINVIVDLAGLSQQLLPLKVITKLQLVICFHYLNSSLSIVMMALTDVMEAGQKKLCSILCFRLQILIQIMFILHKTENALKTNIREKSLWQK